MNLVPQRVNAIFSQYNNLGERKRLRNLVEISSKVVLMLIRGIWWKLLLNKSSGIPLIGCNVTIRNPHNITVGSKFIAEDGCEIQGLSKNGIVFGDSVTIGRYAMIRPSGYYSREIGEGMCLGDNSNIGPYCYIGCSGLVTIGKNVLMGPRVTMVAENHNFEDTSIPIKQQGVTRSPITIEDDCWLASNCVILAGVHIGQGSVVAAGAVVTKDVPPNTIVGGIPARVIRTR